MNQINFVRTNSGLSNQNKFYNSDYTAFTEGGRKSYTITQIESGEFNSTSIDIEFWRNTLLLHGCTKTIHFKAIGSKSSGEEITKRVISGNIKNTLIIKDRDLDSYLEKYIDHPKIIYTKGYSWENDVFTKNNVISVLKDYIFGAQYIVMTLVYGKN